VWITIGELCAISPRRTALLFSSHQLDWCSTCARTSSRWTRSGCAAGPLERLQPTATASASTPCSAVHPDPAAPGREWYADSRVCGWRRRRAARTARCQQGRRPRDRAVRAREPPVQLMRFDFEPPSFEEMFREAVAADEDAALRTIWVIALPRDGWYAAPAARRSASPAWVHVRSASSSASCVPAVAVRRAAHTTTVAVVADAEDLSATDRRAGGRRRIDRQTSGRLATRRGRHRAGPGRHASTRAVSGLDEVIWKTRTRMRTWAPVSAHRRYRGRRRSVRREAARRHGRGALARACFGPSRARPYVVL
jgi:hypothetical protein